MDKEIFLKPCPWCNSQPVFLKTEFNKGVMEYVLTCDNKACPVEEVCAGISEDKIELANKWNSFCDNKTKMNNIIEKLQASEDVMKLNDLYLTAKFELMNIYNLKLKALKNQ